MKWRIWENHERNDLIVGEVIRQKVKRNEAINPPADWDGYLYGRVVDGFGCHKVCHGRAIFVENESWNYEGCLNRVSESKARWQRDGNIQILVD